MFVIEEDIKKLPNKPGVYIMKDKNDKIIYVGKAVSLKNRVRQYFRKNNKTKRIQNMVQLIDHFEYIITDTEAEALILECNLIKKNMPKFNVLLKDDKTYPYIKITIKEEYPSIFTTRKIIKDGAKYFGPYPNANAAKEMISFIKERFKIRQCKKFKYKDRACLNYQIKKCMAPCMGYISSEEYKEHINDIICLLEGKTEKTLAELRNKMKECSTKMQYEKAAHIRDKIHAIEVISEKQKISNLSENDIDIIGVAKNDVEICVEVFFIRNRKIIGRETYFFEEENENEILTEFVKQYYLKNETIPNKIMMREEIQDKSIIEQVLSKQNNKKVEIRTPKKGEKLKLVEMVENNAKITLENKMKTKYNNMLELKQILKLEKIPNKIESYDISNISGEYTVAAMCVIQKGVIRKGLSKLFKIKTVQGQNDVECMKEVLNRRLKHMGDNFGEFPELIFVDGGVSQIRAVQEVVNYHQLPIKVLGMVKNEKHRTRALINEKHEEFELSENLMNLITMFQDTVHETAIGYHKKIRDGQIVKSKLDEIKGIGAVKKRDLLKYFGSVEKIKQASIEEIVKVKSIDEKLAYTIKDELNKI